MTLVLASDLTFTGPALPETFIQHELEAALGKALPSAKAAEPAWKALLRALRNEPLANAGAIRVRNVILGPVVSGLGLTEMVMAEPVRTREGDEPGGLLLKLDGTHLRAWVVDYEADLDAPTKRGLNHRFSPLRLAERVLLATGERRGLLTNGLELRLVLSDPARRASQASFSLAQWKQYRFYDPVPDSFRVFVALACLDDAMLVNLLEQARLKQGQVTKDLRVQARAAVEAFVQGVLEHPANQVALKKQNPATLPKTLWREALIMVYRLLFILRGEAGGRETPPFAFASFSLWRNTYSPSHAQRGNLAWVAQQVREAGLPSGEFLEQGLRTLFRAFEQGLDTPELRIAALGGALFGPHSTSLLSSLRWSEPGCAALLDSLLRAPRGKGRDRALARLSYRDLDVEELGRVYEALLELEPGVAAEPMARLRRAKLEVVVPERQGEKYRGKGAGESPAADEPEAEVDAEGEPAKSKIEWIERIALGRFYLRVGLGRKSSGSFYTPETYVRFLVQETLGPLCDQRSPAADPRPLALLMLKVLDNAMGSGHFLVGVCRYLGDRLYEACLECARRELWDRIPADIIPYMPGKRLEGESESGVSPARARMMCKRLVAVHCLYGVDKNPLAVELARVSLWLESFAEGLPLTFLDHRLVCGDSLLGPVNILGEGVDSPMTPPYANTPIDVHLAAGVRTQLSDRLGVALQKVRALDATVGIDQADLDAKQRSKAELDAALKPFIDLCVAWSGGIMLGADRVDETGYRQALEFVARGDWPAESDPWTKDGDVAADSRPDGLPPGFLNMLAKGRAAGVLVFPLAFPEVFFPTGDVSEMAGFHVVLGNPPWDRIEIDQQTYYSQYDLNVYTEDRRTREICIENLEKDILKRTAWENYQNNTNEESRVVSMLYPYQVVSVDGLKTVGRPDIYRVFAERFTQLVGDKGYCGFLVPSSFHSNEGATGVRRLFLEKTALKSCFSFENRDGLFDIDRRFKFALIVCSKSSQGTGSFQAGFYLHHDEWLFSDVDKRPGLLTYSADFIRLTGGKNLSLLEIRSEPELDLTKAVAQNTSTTYREFCEKYHIKTAFGVELHRNPDFDLLLDVPKNAETLWLEQEGYRWKVLPIHAGKTIHQFTDLWAPLLRYVHATVAVTTRHWKDSVPYYRFVFRMKAASTNERTFISSLIAPGFVCEQTLAVETAPGDRCNYPAIYLMSFTNTFMFDWLVRNKVTTSLSNYLIEPLPFPSLSSTLLAFLVHNGLRLVSSHKGYEPIWNEQLGKEWREATLPHTWPVLAGDEVRWQVRAAIDAVVAQAYGLSREQYAHVLGSFSHKSYPGAPALCLARFDELSALGLEAFTQKYDPYWDVPLVETLPQPVIELPKLAANEGNKVSEEKALYGATDMFGNPVETNLFGEVAEKKRERRKK